MTWKQGRSSFLASLLLLAASTAQAQTVDCAGKAAWSPTTTYSAGAQVTYQGSLYAAVTSTTNVPPNYCLSCGWWSLVGVCGTTPPVCSAAPAVPTNLASSVQTTNSITLTWSPVTPPANCTVTYKVLQGGVEAAVVPTGTSATISGLSANTSYTFTVVAVDGFGASSPSAALSVKTKAAAACTAVPAVPTGLSAPSKAPTSVNLAWNAVSAPANCTVTYRVYSGTVQILTNLTSPSATVTGLTANKTYSFSVTAVDAAGMSAKSAALSVTTPVSGTCSAAPGVPTGLASPTQTSASVNLAWNPVTAPANCTVTYRVYSGTVQILTNLTSPSATVTGLAANRSYSFSVAAADAAGLSAKSAALSVKTLPASTCTQAPAVPTGLASTAKTKDSVSLSWSAVSAPANCTVSYNVYKDGALAITVPTTTATITGLAASTAYSFTVASVDAAGTSAQGTALSVTTNGGGTGLDCSNADPYSPTTTYSAGAKVLYKGSLYEALGQLTNVAPDVCLACGWWKLVGVCDPILPSVPTGLAMTARTKTSISLSWNASTDKNGPGLAGYDILRNGAPVGTSATTTYTDGGLALGTTYTYAVRSRDTAGLVSGLSASISASTKSGDCLAAPSVPTGLASSNATASSVSLRWNASTADVNCTIRYNVYRNGVLLTTVSGTSVNLNGLASGSTYAFTVASTDEVGTSAQSSAVSVTTPAGRSARVGYFIQWGVYARQFFVKNMDTNGMAAKLTHINYAFANIDGTTGTVLNGKVSPTSSDPQSPTQGDGGCDAAADYANVMSAAQSVDGVADTYGQPLAGQFNQLLKLKKKHPHLKVLMSIGGWTYSKYFSDVAATDAARKKFVASAIDAYILGNLPVYNGFGGPGSAKGVFDGIDIDWEWPGAPGHAGNHYGPNDKANFVLLMKEFRTQLDALNDGNHYLLTAFGPAGPQNLDAGWDLPGLMTSFDMINVQGYDFHGAGSDNSWEPNLTGHQSNLYTDVDDPYSFHFSCDDAINYYLNYGVNPRQLTLGIPFYGRGWKGVTAGGVNGEWQVATGASCGQFGCDNLESGTRETYNLRAMVPGTVYHDTQSVAAYLYTGNGGEWWSFDDAWCIEQKMEYVKRKNLLGAMIWELCGDDGTLMTALDSNLP